MRGARGLNRREVLETGAALGLLAGLAPLRRTAAARPRPRGSDAVPRNVIFLVSDGMSMGVPSLAEPFAQQVRGRGTCWRKLLADPAAARGFFDTSSLTSLVTDSAAAVTAWATGVRVVNGALNVLPDGRELRPIGRTWHEQGRRVGLVTTTRVTHATPAGFAAVQACRDDEHKIAPQYLGVVDVLMGGGLRHFHRDLRADKQDLIAAYAGAGYAFWDRREQVTSGPRPGRVLGLFENEHLPYTLDQRNQPEMAERVPTLAEMAAAALEILGRDENGFLLQVEGGRVDHAAHANDAAAMLWDQLAFDDALAVAMAFAKERSDTLVVATSDHGNANPGLNGTGPGYRDSSRVFENVARATASYERVLSGTGDVKALPESYAGDLAQRAFGVSLTEEERRVFAQTLAGEMPPELSRQHRSTVGVLGQLVGNHTGIGWTGVSHTQDWVPISAWGPGAERFSGWLANTDAYAHLLAPLGVEHQNPRMEARDAAEYATYTAAPAAAHWL